MQVRPAARGGRRGAVARELEHDGERSTNGSDEVLAAARGRSRSSAGGAHEPSAGAKPTASGEQTALARGRWANKS
jgi:hypothetical protein